MKKKFLLIIVLIIILIIGVIIKFRAPENLAENNNLKAKIIQTTTKSNKDNNGKLQFEKITDFEWDKLYIITPYVVPKDFCKENGIKGVDLIKTSIETHDDINVLIFVLNNKIVSYMNFSRNQGDFSMLGKNNKNGFSRKNAIFEFKHNENGIEVIKGE